jgi:hypothetical protein
MITSSTRSAGAVSAFWVVSMELISLLSSGSDRASDAGLPG